MEHRLVTRTWYLVRHGETEWNAGGRMQGQLDSRLTARGRAQASGTGWLLGRLGVDAVFASPLGRVRETLAIVAAHVDVAPVFDDRLREWTGGAWDGELYADLPRRWPEEWAAWTADRYHQRAPGGESFVDLAIRARAFVETANAVAARRVAVVAHGWINRTLAQALLGLTPTETMAIDQDNDTVIRVVMNGGAPSVDHFVGDAEPRPGLPASNTR